MQFHAERSSRQPGCLALAARLLPDYGHRLLGYDEDPVPDFWIYFALCASAFLAGAVNAIAGGGTLLTFPALLAITAPVMANGTSTIALLPGSLASAGAYRKDIQHPPRLLRWLAAPSLIGGLIGTLLVTRTEERYFAALIPWLILGATILLMLQPVIGRYVRGHAGGDAGEESVLPRKRLFALACAQLAVSIYGGYFGAGIGILMLSSLAFMGLRNLHEMNALKTLLAVGINGAAAVLFVLEKKVQWGYAAPMAVAAIAGGYLGARFSLRFPPAAVRKVVLAIGFVLSGYYLYRQYGG
ncbi:MAG: sulfite exporter TauE/SafE family protein [Bryobacteraceae bacterium]